MCFFDFLFVSLVFCHVSDTGFEFFSFFFFLLLSGNLEVQKSDLEQKGLLFSSI